MSLSLFELERRFPPASADWVPAEDLSAVCCLLYAHLSCSCFLTFLSLLFFLSACRARSSGPRRSGHASAAAAAGLQL